LAHRTRLEVFAWAAAETAAGRRPSYAEMADWGTDHTLDHPLSRSTVSSWARRHCDPRITPERGVHSTATPTAYTCIHPDDPDEDASSPSASSGGCATESDGIRHFSALSPQQEQAVFLKVSGKTHTEIASTLGIHRSTVIEWTHLPAFAAALSDLRSEAHIVSRESLLAGAQEGVAGLREVQQIMLAIVRGDAVALSPDDERLQADGERYNVIIDPRLQIQAGRVFIQSSRTLMDRGGFHPKSELHLTGDGDSAGEDFSLVEVGDLEEDLEEELAGLDEDEQLLVLLEGGG
jgi:hypothetical protein